MNTNQYRKGNTMSVKFHAYATVLNLHRRTAHEHHVGTFANRHAATVAANDYADKLHESLLCEQIRLTPAEISQKMFDGFIRLAARHGKPKLKSRALPPQFEEEAAP